MKKTLIFVEIDEPGFIVKEYMNPSEELVSGKDLIEVGIKDHPRRRFRKPRWNGRYWVEGDAPLMHVEIDLDKIRAERIEEVKSAIQAKIESILPITKQMNLIREGKTDDPAFQEVDNYRKISDSIEEEINKLQTLDELMNYKIRII